MNSNSYSEFKLAAIQAAPVYFDAAASTEKACRLITEAASLGANLAAFSETWLSGYPFFAWMQPGPDLGGQISADYLNSAVEIPGPEVAQLCSVAKQSKIDVVIGLSERDSTTQGTVYCTLLFISKNGEILGRHRKLKPTERERTVWGEGDASGLCVYQRDYARISALACWEHNMMLPGFTLINEGTQVHIAAWPGTATSRHSFLSAAFASQAAAYVIDVGALLSPQDLPSKYQHLARDMPGQSAIYDPFGEMIAGPQVGEGILVADASTEKIYAAKTECDLGGHYSRPDVFKLYVNKCPTTRVIEVSSNESFEAVTGPNADI